jgi:hypothetical protein
MGKTKVGDRFSSYRSQGIGRLRHLLAEWKIMLSRTEKDFEDISLMQLAQHRVPCWVLVFMFVDRYAKDTTSRSYFIVAQVTLRFYFM